MHSYGPPEYFWELKLRKWRNDHQFRTSAGASLSPTLLWESVLPVSCHPTSGSPGGETKRMWDTWKWHQCFVTQSRGAFAFSCQIPEVSVCSEVCQTCIVLETLASVSDSSHCHRVFNVMKTVMNCASVSGDSDRWLDHQLFQCDSWQNQTLRGWSVTLTNSCIDIVSGLGFGDFEGQINALSSLSHSSGRPWALLAVLLMFLVFGSDQCRSEVCDILWKQQKFHTCFLGLSKLRWQQHVNANSFTCRNFLHVHVLYDPWPTLYSGKSGS